MNDKVVTRFAPSPTGFLHAGNYRTAVFAYLYAKQRGGKFILRIEDTDKNRSRKEYEDNILESLEWLGLPYDGFSRQSENATTHRKYLEKLISENKAYISKETPVKEGDREEVIRFRNPNKRVAFKDHIRGLVEFDTTDLGDFVIARSMDEPTFHLANAVDDFTSGVTHVIRGEDHISNTPRQILIQEAIGAPIPEYAHLPLVLAPDRSKLSKRNGAMAMTDYRDQGFLSEALVNFMALLGWSPQANTKDAEGTNEEVFTVEKLLERFDLSAVQKSGAIFNIEKLQWLNKEHLKRKPKENVFAAIRESLPTDQLTDRQTDLLCQILLERITTLNDVASIWESGEFDFVLESPSPSKELLKTTEHLPTVAELLEALPEDRFVAEHIKSAIWDFATEKGRAEVLWPMRVALTGREKSLDPFTSAELLGKEETLKRLKYLWS